MPMQPRPMAETTGPSAPSWRTPTGCADVATVAIAGTVGVLVAVLMGCVLDSLRLRHDVHRRRRFHAVVHGDLLMQDSQVTLQFGESLLHGLGMLLQQSLACWHTFLSITGAP